MRLRQKRESRRLQSRRLRRRSSRHAPSRGHVRGRSRARACEQVLHQDALGRPPGPCFDERRCPRPATTTTLLLVGLVCLPCAGRAPPPHLPLALFDCVPLVSHASARPRLLHRHRRPSAFGGFRSVPNASSPPLPLPLPAALASAPTSTTASYHSPACAHDPCFSSQDSPGCGEPQPSVAGSPETFKVHGRGAVGRV